VAEEGGIIEGVLGGGEAEAAEGDAAAALDPIAAALATSGAELGRSLDPRLASYLVKQEKLVEIQTEHLHEQRELQLAHLRVRRWKDRLSLTLQGLGVALGVLVLTALGALAWQAHEDHGLVIQAFTAPPAFAARGVSGDTVAADVMDKLSSITSFIRENSFSSTGAVTTDRSSDVKIEIPETGVSLTEAWRLLREWLGSARKVSGSLRDEGDGRITLTARLDGGEVFTATGPASDLGALEQNIAEQVYGATDPNNLAVYLEMHGRKSDAFAAAARYAASAQTREDRANAVVMWGDPSEDPERLARSGRIALRIDPGLMAAHYNIANGTLALEHPQETLIHAQAMLNAKPADQPPQHRGAGAKHLVVFAHIVIDDLTGDFAAAETARADLLPQASERSELLIRNAVEAAWLHDPSASFNMIAEAQIFGSAEPGLVQVARYWADAERDDWAGALTEAQALAAKDQETLAASKDPDAAAGLKVMLERRDRPMVALAQAHAGNVAGALALIASTPADCYGCVRARGQIAAWAGNRAEAERWFAEAIAQGPDLPLAYADRGRTRLDGGDVARALSDAETANRLGPHFADALKLSGDALARQGRWVEAVAKYDAALAEAPAWTALKQARTTAQTHAR
jgi:tetratricopeptide (TPR) repeat protein